MENKTTQYDISCLVRTYSCRHDEFKQINDDTYESSIINGYTITIKAETELGVPNGNYKVIHVSGDTFICTDYWGKDNNTNRLFFFSRTKIPNQVFNADELVKLQYQVMKLECLIEHFKVQNYSLFRDKSKSKKKAGRKPNDMQMLTRYNEFIELHKNEQSMEQIMKIMKISRATYYRYKRYYRLNKWNSL